MPARILKKRRSFFRESFNFPGLPRGSLRHATFLTLLVAIQAQRMLELFVSQFLFTAATVGKETSPTQAQAQAEPNQPYAERARAVSPIIPIQKSELSPAKRELLSHIKELESSIQRQKSKTDLHRKAYYRKLGIQDSSSPLKLDAAKALLNFFDHKEEIPVSFYPMLAQKNSKIANLYLALLKELNIENVICNIFSGNEKDISSAEKHQEAQKRDAGYKDEHERWANQGNTQQSIIASDNETGSSAGAPDDEARGTNEVAYSEGSLAKRSLENLQRHWNKLTSQKPVFWQKKMIQSEKAVALALFDVLHDLNTFETETRTYLIHDSELGSTLKSQLTKLMAELLSLKDKFPLLTQDNLHSEISGIYTGAINRYQAGYAETFASAKEVADSMSNQQPLKAAHVLVPAGAAAG